MGITLLTVVILTEMLEVNAILSVIWRVTLNTAPDEYVWVMTGFEVVVTLLSPKYHLY